MSPLKAALIQLSPDFALTCALNIGACSCSQYARGTHVYFLHWPPLSAYANCYASRDRRYAHMGLLIVIAVVLLIAYTICFPIWLQVGAVRVAICPRVCGFMRMSNTPYMVIYAYPNAQRAWRYVFA